MKHTIFINNKGLIEATINGEVTFEDAVIIGKQALDLATKIEDRGEPVKILIDSTNATGRMNDLANNYLIKMFKNFPLSKIATFGAHGEVAQRQREQAKEADLHKNMAMFANREEAENWLAKNSY